MAIKVEDALEPSSRKRKHGKEKNSSQNEEARHLNSNPSQKFPSSNKKIIHPWSPEAWISSLKSRIKILLNDMATLSPITEKGIETNIIDSMEIMAIILMIA